MKLYIEFSKELNEKEQNRFWDAIVSVLERNGLQATGGNDSLYLEWGIDHTASTLNKKEIITLIEAFLSEKGNMIATHSITL